MSKTVHRYPLVSNHLTVVDMPKGAQLLSCQVKANDESLHLWALVDTEQPLESRTFVVVCTGAVLHDQDYPAMRYVATVQYDDGDFVLHVFEHSEGFRS